jgi:hypothetical protein
MSYLLETCDDIFLEFIGSLKQPPFVSEYFIALYAVIKTMRSHLRVVFYVKTFTIYI